jgi:hypothetical protein
MAINIVEWVIIQTVIYRDNFICISPNYSTQTTLNFQNILMALASRGTVTLLSLGIGEKTWETIAQGRRPQGTVSRVFSPTKGQ